MREVHRELTWGAALWCLIGIAGAIGQWLDINAVKMDRTGGLLWFGFGGVVVLGKLILDCTDAILAALTERQGEVSDE